MACTGSKYLLCLVSDPKMENIFGPGVALNGLYLEASSILDVVVNNFNDKIMGLNG